MRLAEGSNSWHSLNLKRGREGGADGLNARVPVRVGFGDLMLSWDSLSPRDAVPSLEARGNQWQGR